MAALCVGCTQSVSVAEECAGERARARNVARKINEEWPLRGADHVTELTKDVVRRLAAGERPRRWEIIVFRSRNAEAYSIGDGRIYISDGTVRACETESELAAILAHEMAHQLLGHFCEGAKPATAGRFGAPRSVGSVSLRIDPAKELAADRFGLDLIARVGYNPLAALSIALRVEREHPRGHLDEMGRVERLERLVTQYKTRIGFESDGFDVSRRMLHSERSLDR